MYSALRASFAVQELLQAILVPPEACGNDDLIRGSLAFPSGLNNGGCYHAIKEPVAVSLEQVNMGGAKTLEWECIRCIQKQRPGVILISQQHLQRIALSR